MRHTIHLVWLLPFLGAAALGADDLPQPKKDPAAPARLPSLPEPRPLGTPDGDAAELQRLLGQLRSQRESLRNERSATERETVAPGPLTKNEEEIARLRKRMDELTARAARRSDGGTPDPRPLPLDRDSSPFTLPGGGNAANGGAIDQVAVAQNYFRAGDYEAALDAYRKVPTGNAPAEQRAPTLYMIATCLRKLGRRDEAAKVYREAAGIKGDEFVAECARWQLETLAWRRDMEAQIDQIKQRRKALETKP
jgi:tetratricopeptide (TPR) repeat protein